LNCYAFGRQIAGRDHKSSPICIVQQSARSNAHQRLGALDESPDLVEAAAGARISATDAFHNASRKNINPDGGLHPGARLPPLLQTFKTLSLALGASRYERPAAGQPLRKERPA
jgi:hypothetical protein